MDFTEKTELVDLESHPFFDLATPPFDVESHTIYSVISGSRAYGTNVATSDVDERGIFLEPPSYIYGLKKVAQIENQSKDICYFSLRRFFELAYKNNVHALELLFMPDDVILFTKPAMQKVLDKRDLFMTKNIGYSFGGYAHAQLKILNLKKENKTGRVNLIEKFGYDTKFAAHVIRLFRSGAEALITGQLNVRRPDANYLLEIRNGKYSFEEFVQFEKNGKKQIVIGGIVKQEIDKFEQAFQNTKLPSKPNFVQIESLLMEIYQNHLKI